MLRLDVEHSLSEKSRRLVTKEVSCADSRPVASVCSLEIFLWLPGTADAEVTELPLRDVIHLTLRVEFVWPCVLSTFVFQHKPSLHFPHHKNVTKWISVSVELVGNFIRVYFTKDFPGVWLRPLHSVAKFRKDRS